MTGLRWGLAVRLAARELRGGIRGFRIFLACLALGVAAVAAVGSVRTAITEGLSAEGERILGGDAQITLTYRTATEEERGWMEARALAVSEVIDFRSMVRTADGTDRSLTQVKGVDDLYPLAGAVRLAPELPLADALAERDGLPGLVMEAALIERLGASIGDRVALGAAEFRLAAALEEEPDKASGGFAFGPRTLVSAEGLAATGIVAPGTLYETHYRLTLPEEADLDALQREIEAAFPAAGIRWRDRRQAAPGVERFTERIGAFLVLVGLAALGVGGVGVAAAVRTYLEEKTATIATLKSLGASGAEITAVYLLQIAALAALGILLGLAVGGAGPLLLGPLLANSLPVPALFTVYGAPLAEAALYGALTALVFALWPLLRARRIRPAALFRDHLGTGSERPSLRDLVPVGIAALALGGAAVWLSAAPWLALWFALGLAGALAALWGAGILVRRGARALARTGLVHGRPSLRLALAAVGGPGGDTTGAMLSLGLGLTVLATIGQIDHNLRAVIDNELPEKSPAFFLIDIQSHQKEGVLASLADTDGVEEVATAPMLRGVVTQLDGVPAAEAEIDPAGAWILRGDRGVTYAAAPPLGTEVLAGAWWPEDYAGPPLVSFSAEHAVELGLAIGDSITVSVLGREIEAEIANLRRVDFRDMGINFLMVFDPGAFAGAPHTHIATVHARAEAEAQVLRNVGADFPNVTAIGVRDAISRVSEGLGKIASAARWAAAVTLVTGLVVLVGAAAAGERRRIYEAAVMKTLGAERGAILWSLALRSAVTGFAAGLLAIGFGGLAAWAVMIFVLEAEFAFEPVSAVAVVAGGALASLAAGLLFAWRPLAARPARVLRAAG